MERLSNLVSRAQAGDRDACSELVEATQAMAYAVALRVLHDREMAHDATQEAYLRAFRHLADLDDPDDPLGMRWLEYACQSESRQTGFGNCRHRRKQNR